MQQQNPPRFPFEQRTRAGLLLFMGTLRLYTKQALSISEQIELLKSRGLNIADSSKAEKFLGEVSYFRFVQYLRPMEEDKTTHRGHRPGLRNRRKKRLHADGYVQRNSGDYLSSATVQKNKTCLKRGGNYLKNRVTAPVQIYFYLYSVVTYT